MCRFQLCRLVALKKREAKFPVSPLPPCSLGRVPVSYAQEAGGCTLVLERGTAQEGRGFRLLHVLILILVGASVVLCGEGSRC